MKFLIKLAFSYAILASCGKQGIISVSGAKKQASNSSGVGGADAKGLADQKKLSESEKNSNSSKNTGNSQNHSVSQIFSSYCYSCHGNSVQAAGVNLQASNVTNELLIKAAKLAVEKKMPPAGAPKPTEPELQFLSQWLLSGGKNVPQIDDIKKTFLSGQGFQGHSGRISDTEYNTLVSSVLKIYQSPAFDFSIKTKASGWDKITLGGFYDVDKTAEKVSKSLTSHQEMKNLFTCPQKPTTHLGCPSDFIHFFGSRLHRKTLSSKEHETYLLAFQNAAKILPEQNALEFVVSIMLKSPQFLHHFKSIPTNYKNQQYLKFLSRTFWNSPEIISLEESAKDTDFQTASARKLYLENLLDFKQQKGTGFWTEYFEGIDRDKLLLARFEKVANRVWNYWGENYAGGEPELNLSRGSAVWSGFIKSPVTAEVELQFGCGRGLGQFVFENKTIGQFENCEDNRGDKLGQKIKVGLQKDKLYSFELSGLVSSYGVAALNLKWTLPGMQQTIIPSEYLYPPLSKSTYAASSILAQKFGFADNSLNFKDKNLFPEATSSYLSKAQQSALTLVSNALTSPNSTLVNLLSENNWGNFTTLLDTKFLASQKPEQKLNPAGLLAHPAVLLGQSSSVDVSPVKFGKLVREHLLCDIVPPPPPGVETTLPTETSANPIKNQLLKFEMHRSNVLCATCHNKLDSLGIPFLRYDPIGRYVNESAGVMAGRIEKNELGEYSSLQELGKLLSSSQEFKTCLTADLVKGLRGSAITKPELGEIEKISKTLDGKAGEIKRWYIEILASEILKNF
jgi:Protein of unknown function (DUF1588)/Cytochrome C oxidase, cbb3-type, subunit III